MGTVDAAHVAVHRFAEALQERTMRFATAIAGYRRTLPNTFDGRHVRDQLFRSGTSVAANYRSACCARSRRDFIAKLGIVVEESQETVFWLKFVDVAEISHSPAGRELLKEARELLAIFTQSAKTASSNYQ